MSDAISDAVVPVSRRRTWEVHDAIRPAVSERFESLDDVRDRRWSR
jgi:hypothetical protein